MLLPKVVLMLAFINMEEVGAGTEFRIIIPCNTILLLPSTVGSIFYAMFLYTSVFKTVLEGF